MPGPAVGLYCAVGQRFDLLVSTCTAAAGETQAVFNQRVESLRTWLGALNLGSVRGRQRRHESGAAWGQLEQMTVGEHRNSDAKLRPEDLNSAGLRPLSGSRIGGMNVG